jgi:hypothetical protein
VIGVFGDLTCLGNQRSRPPWEGNTKYIEATLEEEYAEDGEAES